MADNSLNLARLWHSWISAIAAATCCMAIAQFLSGDCFLDPALAATKPSSSIADVFATLDNHDLSVSFSEHVHHSWIGGVCQLPLCESRCGKSFLKRKPHAKPTTNSVFVQTTKPNPFSDGMRFPGNAVSLTDAAIVLLLKSRGPAAVSWFVVAVRIGEAVPVTITGKALGVYN